MLPSPQYLCHSKTKTVPAAITQSIKPFKKKKKEKQSIEEQCILIFGDCTPLTLFFFFRGEAVFSNCSRLPGQ